ncbi:MAG: PAS domain-containing protein [Campylobacterota bacterium]|nr:PAS domain-containing protein [Campylobacterota bacterium]
MITFKNNFYFISLYLIVFWGWVRIADRIFEITKEEFTPSYEGFLSFIHPDDLQRVNEAYQKSVETKAPYDITHRLLLGSGQIKYVRERGVKYYDESDNALLSTGSVQDITQQQELENQIITEHNFISTLIDTANVIIAVIEPDGTMSRINRYGEEFVGYTQKEIASKPYFWTRFLPESIKDKVTDIIKLANQGEVVKSFQNSWISKEGEERVFEWSNQLLRNKRGELQYIFTIGIDITTRVKTLKLLEHQKEEFETIFKTTKDGLAIIDLESNFIKLNDAYVELTGYSHDELLTQSCIALSTPLDQIKAKQAVEQAIANGYVTNFEKSCYRKDGSMVTINMSIALMPDREHLLISTKNITQEKKIRDKLNLLLEEQQVLLSLFNKGEAILFKWNNDEVWSIAYVSQNIYRLLGFSHKEFMQHDIVYANCIHQEDLSRVMQEVQSAVKTNADFFKHEPYRIMTKEGEIRWVLDYTVTQKDAQGNITHFIGYIVDITTQKQNELALIEAKESADRANAAKSEFLANMSHEIRTPLNGIIGLNDMLLETHINKQQQEYLDKMKRSSHALLHIINDILDYSKIEARKLDIVHSEFYLDDLLHNVENLFSFEMSKKGLEFIFTIDPNTPLYLIGDTLRLTQILNNLVGNAVKFTHQGFVHLDICIKEIKEEKVTLYFKIKDSGIGISQAKQKRLFRAFEQGDSSMSKEYRGTGLGLMISKRLVEMMQGAIEMESQEGVGSIFSFTLEFPFKNKKVSFDIDRLQKQRFLIVDDSSVDREYLHNILNFWKIEAEVATSGIEALQKVQKDSFDCLLIDWKMPQMDGLKLIEELKNSHVDAHKILMVTSYDKQELLKRAAARGILVSDILTKPYTPSTLYNALIGKKISMGSPTRAQKTFVLGKPKELLLVEDNETNQLIALDLFKNYGFRVDVAGDGLEAFEKAKTKEYDIIFMDLQMPFMDGFEAAREIRSFNQNVPIVALSAAVMQKDKIKTHEAGMNHHISKPIDKVQLLEVLKEYFELKDSDTQENFVENEKNIPKVASKINSFNMDELNASLGGGEYERLYPLYASFRTSFQKSIDEVEHMDRTSEAFKFYIHKLKGAAATLKIHSIAKLCERIEKDEAIEPKVIQLKENLKEVIDEIEHHISPLLTLQQNSTIAANEAKEYIAKMLDDIEVGTIITTQEFKDFVRLLQPFIDKKSAKALEDDFINNEEERLIEHLDTITKSLL